LRAWARNVLSEYSLRNAVCARLQQIARHTSNIDLAIRDWPDIQLALSLAPSYWEYMNAAKEKRKRRVSEGVAIDREAHGEYLASLHLLPAEANIEVAFQARKY
jgi:hypothetical protein